jgi:hypothetical protein
MPKIRRLFEVLRTLILSFENVVIDKKWVILVI